MGTATSSSTRVGTTSPLVLVRIQGGIEPLAGLCGVGAVLAWRVWRDGTSGLTWLAAASAGLTITVIVYDLGCVARDACAGAYAPAPLGFAMSGLSESRHPRHRRRLRAVCIFASATEAHDPSHPRGSGQTR